MVIEKKQSILESYLSNWPNKRLISDRRQKRVYEVRFKGNVYFVYAFDSFQEYMNSRILMENASLFSSISLPKIVENVKFDNLYLLRVTNISPTSISCLRTDINEKKAEIIGEKLGVFYSEIQSIKNLLTLKEKDFLAKSLFYINDLGFEKEIDPEILKQIHQKLTQAKESVSYLQRKNSVIHGDLTFRNLFINDQLNLSLIDFEHLAIGDPISDITKLVWRSSLGIKSKTTNSVLRMFCRKFGMEFYEAHIEEGYIINAILALNWLNKHSDLSKSSDVYFRNLSVSTLKDVAKIIK